MDSEVDMEKEIRDLLMQEYDIVKSEMSIYISLYHKYSNFASFLIASAVALIVGLSTIITRSGPKISNSLDQKYEILKILEFTASQGIFFFVEVVFILYVIWLTTAQMGYMYIIELLAVRIKIIERSINEDFGREIFTWEAHISPKYIRDSHKLFGVGAPNYMRAVYSYVIFAFFLSIMLISANSIMGTALSAIYFVFVIGCVGISIFQHRRFYLQVVPSIRAIERDERKAKIVSLTY